MIMAKWDPDHVQGFGQVPFFNSILARYSQEKDMWLGCRVVAGTLKKKVERWEGDGGQETSETSFY